MGPPEKVERRLAAIFAADVAGYSRLMEQDEVGTLRALTAHREIMDRLIAEHGGRIANTAGDSVLAEFPSAVDAVQCAVEVQNALAVTNQNVPEECRLHFRIGVHVGDVMLRGSDLLGDSVNIAARLQALAQPGGICISRSAHEYVRQVLSLAFTDLGPQHVKNITDPVRAYALNGKTKQGTFEVPGVPPIPDKPSIAVLPFDNIGNDREDVYLADGIVEDIIAALSRVRSFFVIARNSTFTYKGRAVNIQQVGRELGVGYVLEGSVRRSRNRVRVTTQLIDATTGAQFWGERYEGLVDDIFDFQDEITVSVVGAIQPSIRAAEVERARRKRPDSLDAYDFVMRSLPLVWSYDAAANETATELLEKALSLDPGYPLALALSAWCSAQRVFYIWSKDVENDKCHMHEKARRAADLAPDDPTVLTMLGIALTISREFQAAQMVIEKALALDPNSAWAWNRSAFLHTYLDDPDTGIAHFEKALRLSPLDPMTFMTYAGIGMAHFVAGRYLEAAEWDEKALLAHPKAIFINRLLAAAYALSGKQAEAESSVRRLLAAYPDMTVRTVRAAFPLSAKVLERLCDGLRRAGLPE
jgi:adenylate cyclase